MCSVRSVLSIGEVSRLLLSEGMTNSCIVTQKIKLRFSRSDVDFLICLNFFGETERRCDSHGQLCSQFKRRPPCRHSVLQVLLIIIFVSGVGGKI